MIESGFDPKKYIDEQSKFILDRVNNYDKLYLEFGGKLIGDKHAKRVLPGFDEDAKIKLLQKMTEKKRKSSFLFQRRILANLLFQKVKLHNKKVQM